MQTQDQDWASALKAIVVDGHVTVLSGGKAPACASSLWKHLL